MFRLIVLIRLTFLLLVFNIPFALGAVDMSSVVKHSFIKSSTAGIEFDSLANSKVYKSSFLLKNEITNEPICGAVLKLSDPLRHGVVFSYESDSLGQFQMEIQEGQCYFFRIQKEGFEPLEMKMTSSKIKELKSLTIIQQIRPKKPIFALTNNQLLQIVSFDVISPEETYLCWLHPQELNNTQIAGISHISFTPFRVLTFLSL